MQPLHMYMIWIFCYIIKFVLETYANKNNLNVKQFQTATSSKDGAEITTYSR